MNHRYCLLTGGSRGIGKAIRDRLTEDSWSVIAPNRSQLDLSDELSVWRYLEGLEVPIDGLVLNAGINIPSHLVDISMETWDMVFQVNLRSSFQIVSRIVPDMSGRSFGRIVVLSSAYASRARPGRMAYSVSKAALEAMVRSLSVEYAHLGVMTNAVAPGFVDTELTSLNNSPQEIRELLQRVPRDRLAGTHEVAHAVGFLMSERNDYISGQVLAVDGGFSCT